MSVSALSPYPFFSVKTISILAYCFCWNLGRWKAKISFYPLWVITPVTFDSGSMADSGNPLQGIRPELSGWCSRSMARRHCQCYQRLWERRKTMNKRVEAEAHAEQPTTQYPTTHKKLSIYNENMTKHARRCNRMTCSQEFLWNGPETWTGNCCRISH